MDKTKQNPNRKLKKKSKKTQNVGETLSFSRRA